MSHKDARNASDSEQRTLHKMGPSVARCIPSLESCPVTKPDALKSPLEQLGNVPQACHALCCCGRDNLVIPGHAGFSWDIVSTQQQLDHEKMRIHEARCLGAVPINFVIEHMTHLRYAVPMWVPSQPAPHMGQMPPALN